MVSTPSSAGTFVVVEDDPFVRAHAAMMFEDLGYSVISCDKAEDALSAIERCAGDVSALFTDVSLAGETSGLRLARLVSVRWPRINVLVASGRVLPQEEDLPPRAQFIGKPWVAEEVIAALAVRRPDDE